MVQKFDPLSPSGAVPNQDLDALLTLAQVCRAVPALEGRRMHLSAAWRWCRLGVLARNGKRIRLRHTRIGRRVMVPVNAVSEFLDNLAKADAEYFDTPAPAPVVAASKPTSPKLRERQIREAEAACAKRGI